MNNEYLLKVTNVYRVPTVEDALALRDRLQETECGELSSFSYTTKYIKAKGEILDEYQLVKATITFTPEKEPDLQVSVSYKEGFVF